MCILKDLECSTIHFKTTQTTIILHINLLVKYHSEWRELIL
mgnify:CR=1 FL=1